MALMLIGEHPIATRPLKLLFSQHTVCEAQEPGPKPAVLRGEQVRPTATVGPTTRPTSDLTKSCTCELAVVTELQHWTGPVLQELLIPEG